MSNVKDFGAVGDGNTDDTAAVRHAVSEGDGTLLFPAGTYRLTETIDVALEACGPVAIDGAGGTARVLMTGPGPALRLVGTHSGTGSPASIRGNVLTEQRMPTVSKLVIEGAHPEADGIALVKTMQTVIESVLVYRCRVGIHLSERNRNVLIRHCHVYFNTGPGIFLDRVNLHQINITGCHISYNRLGGIRVEGAEIRNLQITGNDIEYNNHAQHHTKPEPTAEIYVDTSMPGASVNEITVASNTIQATASRNGCNIRILDTNDGADLKPRLWAISGNIIGSQENNVHLTGCHAVAISGNCIYSCSHRNLLVENSHHINITGNVFRRHNPEYGTGVRLDGCHDIVLSGCTIHDEHPDGQSSGASLLEIVSCRRINICGCQLLDGVPHGLHSADCSDVTVTGCTVHDTRPDRKSSHAIRFAGAGSGNLVAVNSLDPRMQEPILSDAGSGLRIEGNVHAR